LEGNTAKVVAGFERVINDDDAEVVSMARALVIVESVAKATRIQGMLGSDYIVKPSIGHIRDLPESASDIPASVKSEKWARLGINVNDHFKPVYFVSSDRNKIVAELKDALKQVDEL